MRVLVDTSVWIDHFHSANKRLEDHLQAGQVYAHTVVIGELAAGSLRHSTEILRHLQKLNRANEISLSEGFHLIDTHSLAGRGLSWSDIQLLAAARLGALVIWTRDRVLAEAAAQLDVIHFVDSD